MKKKSGQVRRRLQNIWYLLWYRQFRKGGEEKAKDSKNVEIEQIKLNPREDNAAMLTFFTILESWSQQKS